jgi:hypothetical protein
VLVMTALRRALQERRPAPGLVHHSDRGLQYAYGDYTDLLKEHSITISMSRKGNPQPEAAPFGARLSAAGGVRTDSNSCCVNTKNTLMRRLLPYQSLTQPLR